jgi:hypothetical protein
MKRNSVPFILAENGECRSAALAQVLNYFGDPSSSKDISNYCTKSTKFRDWDYLLGLYAISRGFNATIHTRSISIFDPTWFKICRSDLLVKLSKKVENLSDLSARAEGFKKFELEAKRVIEFLNAGGDLNFSPFSINCMNSYLDKKIPIITTFTGPLLYGLPKETFGQADDIGGDPWKHSLVISSYSKENFRVVDPSKIKGRRYDVKADSLLDSMIRYDSNFLAVFPRKK